MIRLQPYGRFLLLLRTSWNVSSSFRMLDTTHSLLIYASIWVSLITNYGNKMAIDMVPMYVCGVVPFYTMNDDDEMNIV